MSWKCRGNRSSYRLLRFSRVRRYVGNISSVPVSDGNKKKKKRKGKKKETKINRRKWLSFIRLEFSPLSSWHRAEGRRTSERAERNSEVPWNASAMLIESENLAEKYVKSENVPHHRTALLPHVHSRLDLSITMGILINSRTQRIYIDVPLRSLCNRAIGKACTSA